MIKFTRLIALTLITSSPVFAQDISIIGNTEQFLRLTQPEANLNSTAQGMFKSNASSDIKSIMLLNMKLSKKAQNIVSQRVEQALKNSENPSSMNHSLSNTPKHRQLGMNKVPVLDQGQFGTCVTFAVTAAMDAVIKKGDYISQLCSLQLGTYLAQNSDQPSGWDGSFGRIVLQQIQTFGIINQSNQKKYGCGGEKYYPYWYAPTTGMSPKEYAQYSEAIVTHHITSSPLLDESEAFLDKTDMNDVLNNVKAALDNGHRISFGVLIPRADLGTVGAVGWHKYLSDTWILTSDMAQDLQDKTQLPGHEMVITGYDDEAVVMDSSGSRQHGLLTLRNSWGSRAGDWGDFYMSYDYFKALTVEANEIISVK